MRALSPPAWSASMLATIAICTRDRAPLLIRCLDALSSMRVPARIQWEVLVIDNASSDGTAGVVESYADRLPVRAAVEAQPGVSHARNRAVAEALGTYICWLDDDALVDPQWLASYACAFARWPDDVVFGGPIEVLFDVPLPEWFRRVLPRIASIFGSRDLGPEFVPLAAHEARIPFGANFVTRAAEQRRYVFDTNLGRHPEHPGRGSEETEMMMMMLAAGHSGRWVPGARVRHIKGDERINLEFLDAHLASYGEYRARRESPWGPRVGGAPLGAWTRVASAVVRYEVARRMQPPERWIEYFIEASEARGGLRGHRNGARPRDVQR